MHKQASAELPSGIATYDSTSETIAWKMAKSSSPTRSERQRLGEQLIRDSNEAAHRIVGAIRRHEAMKAMDQMWLYSTPTSRVGNISRSEWSRLLATLRAWRRSRQQDK
jgi:hypothetical protein